MMPVSQGELHLPTGAEIMIANDDDADWDNVGEDTDLDLDGLLAESEALDLKAQGGAAVAKSARKILERAVKARLDELDRATLIASLAKNTGLTRTALKKTLKFKQDAYDSAHAPSAEEVAERLAEAEATAAAERGLHRDELWEKVKLLAKDPRLLDRMVRFIEDKGIVGERAGILAIYLAMTSRLHRRKAMSLLRRGASAAGKNAPIEEVLKLFPPDAIYEMTDGSPKSLVFYGGADEVDALKGKVIYIHEAAAIAPKRGEEDDKSRLIRMLISEGRIVYPISQIDPQTNEIRTRIYIKNGPIAVIVTSARNNVEPEMLTRLLVCDADETTAQTDLILSETLQRASGELRQRREPKLSLEQWQDLQHWLQLSGPFEVFIPFALAIRAAYADLELRLPLRARRDVVSILTAVHASAIVHQAQRKTGKDGAIIAKLDDYRTAHAAFADGMRSLYFPTTARTTVLLVRVIEDALAAEEAKRLQNLKDWEAAHPNPTDEERKVSALHIRRKPVTQVHLSYRQIAERLGLNTISSIGDRVATALAEEVISVDTPLGGQRSPRVYSVRVPSKVLTARSNQVVAVPSPEVVQHFISHPAAAKKLVARSNARAKAAKAAAGSSPYAADADVQSEEGEHR